MAIINTRREIDSPRADQQLYKYLYKGHWYRIKELAVMAGCSRQLMTQRLKRYHIDHVMVMVPDRDMTPPAGQVHPDDREEKCRRNHTNCDHYAGCWLVDCRSDTRPTICSGYQYTEQDKCYDMRPSIAAGPITVSV